MIYSKAKVSPVGTVNKTDLKKIARDTIIFFAAPILMYLGQIQGTLSQNDILIISDFIPNSVTIGAVQGWGIGIAINFFLKFSDGKK